MAQEYVIETYDGLEYSIPEADVADVVVGDELRFVGHGDGHPVAQFRPGGWVRWFLRETDEGGSP